MIVMMMMMMMMMMGRTKSQHIIWNFVRWDFVCWDLFLPPAAASSPLSSSSSTDHHAIIDLKFGSFNPGIVFVRGAILCEIYYRKAKACFAIKVNGAEI